MVFLFIAAMASWGYIRGKNVRGAPYDFRYAPHSQIEYFHRLAHLIEETYEINGNQKVAIMTHSMGGLYGLYFLNRQPQEWKDHYIHSFIAISAPWGGTALMHQVFASGMNWGVDMVDPVLLREQQRSLETSPMLFARPGTWTEEHTIIRTPSRKYNAFDIEPFLEDVEFSIGLEILKHFNSSDYERRHPGVDFKCVVSTGIDTPEKFIYDKHFDELDYQRPAKIVYGPGDGTVNLRSLRACREMDTQGNVDFYRIPDATHNGILANADFADFLKSQLTIEQSVDEAVEN